MNIWIDLANSPHVLFFGPIIKILEGRKHRLFITTRHFAETVPLADQYGLSHTITGRHGGKGMIGKAFAVLQQTLNSIAYVRKKKIDLAVSHNSNTQALAARVLNIPMVTIMDYEYQPANHINFRLATKVIVPTFFSDEALRKYGASPQRVDKYDGIKEDVYLSDFRPDPNFRQQLSMPDSKILITMRPPATGASYHRFENPLFDELFKYVISTPNTFVILLPRGADQRACYSSLTHKNLFVPDKPLDGPNLIYHSDLMISAGGTMNREASVLGTPVYTVFKGTLGNVDQHLIKAGKMVQIKGVADLPKILVKKKKAHDVSKNNQVVESVVEKILSVKND